MAPRPLKIDISIKYRGKLLYICTVG
ncbi:hypothetical protein AAS21_gp189 [Pantoea phage vB_PagS_AAS21]|uniref:Uncharacterized protein n=1 Tax=Pantoea phage vB_PagS_AAS21 TaxID=2575261 RepID=A0A4Y5P1U5_9CAUD|nr:hypothetical protein AAS21_gp189 [Pantoea phage vB_PagS_AAS21]